MDKCVAVIDDDESVCRSVGRLLRAAGIDSVSYPSAEAFLASSRRQFDCLILDIQLQGISGIELQQRLDASGSRVPVLFITAYDEPRVREQALRTGCAAFIRKNEPAQVVLDAIHKAMAR